MKSVGPAAPVQYLLDRGADVEVPGIAAPISKFDDLVAPVMLALEQEKRVTAQINDLTAIAREKNDFASDQFLQWFIKEQVEEVSKMSSLVTVVTRATDDIEAIEEYVSREQSGVDTDPTAPPQPGA